MKTSNKNRKKLGQTSDKEGQPFPASQFNKDQRKDVEKVLKNEASTAPYRKKNEPGLSK